MGVDEMLKTRLTFFLVFVYVIFFRKIGDFLNKKRLKIYKRFLVPPRGISAKGRPASGWEPFKINQKQGY
jgi:hypothetical protein